MEVNRQPDERGGSAEERWREIFDKVFARLRADHPADEWTLRIVDQLHEKQETESENADPLVELFETDATEETIKSEAIQAQETEPGDAQQAELIETSAEKADENSDLASVHDVIGLSNAENLVQTGQSVQVEMPTEEPLVDQSTQEPVIAAEEPIAEAHESQVGREAASFGCEIELAEHLHNASGEEVAQAVNQGQPTEVLLAALHDQTNVHVMEASDDQQCNEQITVVEAAQQPSRDVISAGENQFEIAQSEHIEVVEAAGVANHQEDLPDSSNNEEASGPDVGAVEAVILQTPPDKLEPLANQSTEEPALVSDEQPMENGSHVGQHSTEESPESEAIRMYAETHFISHAPNLPRTDMDIEPQIENQEGYKPESLVNGDSYDEPEKQVDELEIKPAQVEQENPLLKKTEQASQTPKRPPSPAKKDQSEEHSRKPEWMRRPLVRKGSVGRFLGRMKETMQSKRFHPDRLPVVVPPPLPDPPKRPPRRKTLHNLDLTRESINAARAEQGQTEADTVVQTAPSPQPSIETDNRSATLKSSTSERRRKNSVGRFLGRVLSAKHANQPESGTAAEEAPLLQDAPPSEPAQQQTVIATVADTPARSVSPTPAPSEKSRKLPHASLTDVSQYFRRILRPKTPTADEAKNEAAKPERPPPPHPQSNDVTHAEEENASNEKIPVIKQGRVHFKCQKCAHQWRSAKGLARFEIVTDQPGDGICHGEVLVRLYGQQCSRCPVGADAPIFETADWSVREVERALTELLAEISRRHYPGYPRRPETDERGQRAHQRRLCQACQEGVCQIKAPS